MIARTWWGATRAEDADAYLAYMMATGFRAYRETPGNRGVRVLRRTGEGATGTRAEFLVVSFWESTADVRRFAGDDVERAVFYPEDERYLLARDEHVTHYEVVFSDDGAA